MVAVLGDVVVVPASDGHIKMTGYPVCFDNALTVLTDDDGIAAEAIAMLVSILIAIDPASS